MSVNFVNFAKAYWGTGGSISSAALTTLTIAAGSNRALICKIQSNGALTSPTATWGAQSMTLLGSIGDGSPGNFVYMFGLANPNTGNQTLTVSFTAGTYGSNSGIISGEVYTGASQVGGTTTFANFTSTNASTGTPANITVTSAINHLVSAVGMSGSPVDVTAAVSPAVTIYHDSAWGNVCSAYSAGGSSVTVSFTTTGGTSTVARLGVDIVDAVITGTMGATDPSDTASFAGSVVVSGVLAAIEAADIASFAGSVGSAVITGTLTANETPALLSNSSFPENSAVNTVIGTLSIAAGDVAAFNGAVGLSGYLQAIDPQDTALFVSTFSGTLVANEVGIALSNYVMAENAAVNTLIGNLSVVGIDGAVFNGTVGVSGTLGASESPDVALFNGLTGISGTLTAVDTRDIASFTGTPVIGAVLVATDPLDVATFDAILTHPPPVFYGTLDATDAPDSASFAGELHPGGPIIEPPSEDDPANFANWKFGQRFDRSLTRRFPWQNSFGPRA